MANEYSSVTVTGYNASPPPDDGSNTSANEITWAGIKSKLADPIKTALDAVNTNVLAAIGSQFGYNIESVSTDLTLGAGDTNKFIVTTGSHTITLPAAATAGSSTLYAIINGGSGTTTVAGNGSETIDGVNTFTLAPGQFALVGCNGAAWNSASNRFFPPLRGYLSGLALSRNSGTPNTKIDVAAGQATDDTNFFMLNRSATVTIDTAGTGANGLDTGTLALSTLYHAFLIGKLDGTTAGLLSTSFSSPTMPTGYIFKRRIGSVRTDASTHFLDFLQNGKRFRLLVPLLDGSSVALTTTYADLTLSAPPSTIAFGKVSVPSGSSNIVIQIRPKGASDGTPSGAISPLSFGNEVTGITNGWNMPWMEQLDSSAKMQWAASGSVNGNLTLEGWYDDRGQFS